MKLYRKSRNLIPFPYNVSVYSKNVKFTVQNDGGVYVKGKTGNESEYINIDKKQGFALLNSATKPTDGKYYISCSYTNLTSEQVRVIINQFGDVSVVVRANQEVDGVAYPMLNEGDIKFPYEPYTGQRVKLLYGSKNLVDEKAFSELSDVTVETFEGEECFKVAPKQINHRIPLKAKAGDVITVSLQICAPNKASMTLALVDEAAINNTWIRDIVLDEPQTSFITMVGTKPLKYDCEYFDIRFYSIANRTPIYIKNIMLNKGTTALPYDKYFPLSKMNLFLKSRNLIPYPYAETTTIKNGVTFTDNGDGSITINGTATDICYFNLNWDREYKSGQYTLSYSGIKNVEGFYVNFQIRKPTVITYSVSNPQAKTTFALDGGEVARLYLSLYKGVKCDNVIIYPMLNEGETALPYEPPQEYPN